VERDWVAEFERTYTGSPSAVAERVWGEVLGPEYPVGLDPYSFVSVSELNRFRGGLRVGPGDQLVDVGCGRGGAGLWVAASTGANLVGLDIAEAALEAARKRATAMGIQADFRVGAFEHTGLESEATDAVMSVDALLFTPNKFAALRELRRILRPAGRLVLTSWDSHRQPPGRPPQVDDHRPLLSEAGFEVEVYDETENWLDRQRQTCQGLLAALEDLARETGTTVEEERAGIEEMMATFDTMSRRFLIIATAA
jgi:cyclopropane fatty-acyl-phospholipid synthase-like methyltransferase